MCILYEYDIRGLRPPNVTSCRVPRCPTLKHLCTTSTIHFCVHTNREQCGSRPGRGDGSGLVGVGGGGGGGGGSSLFLVATPMPRTRAYLSHTKGSALFCSFLVCARRLSLVRTKASRPLFGLSVAGLAFILRAEWYTKTGTGPLCAVFAIAYPLPFFAHESHPAAYIYNWRHFS